MSHMMPGEGRQPHVAEWMHLQRQQQLAADGGRFTGGPTGGTPTCECGLFAVGICTVCKKPTCAKHAGPNSDALVCTRCNSPEARARREQQEREQAEAARRKAMREQEARAAFEELPRLLGAPLARWMMGDVKSTYNNELERYIQEQYQARLMPVSGRELAEAFTLGKVPVHNVGRSPRPWTSDFWSSVARSPHPGGWQVERHPGAQYWQYFEGWFLQPDGSAFHVVARYRGQSKGYFAEKTRPADHMYNVHALLALQRRLNDAR